MGNDIKTGYSDIMVLGNEGCGKTTFLNTLLSTHHPLIHEFFVDESFKHFFTLTLKVAEDIQTKDVITSLDTEKNRLSNNLNNLTRVKSLKNFDETSIESLQSIVNTFTELWSEQYFIQFSEQEFEKETKELVKDNLEKLKDIKFPSKSEIYKFYKKRTGTSQFIFLYQNILYRLIGDVPGSYSHRKNWSQFYEMVGTFIYIISLSDFDEYTTKDEISMLDSLNCFEETITDILFEFNPNIIVIFNKKDELQQKIEKEDKLSYVFPAYKGGKNLNNATNFIMEKFKSKINKRLKNIKYFCGNVNDDDFVKEVFKGVHNLKKKRNSILLQ
eukprot:gene7435-11758_t